MLLLPTYTQLKQRLSSICDIQYFTGQYMPGESEGTYTIPVMYIEMPKDVIIHHLPKGITLAKNCTIKIHYLSNAPFTDTDNPVQEELLLAHEANLQEIDRLINEWNAVDNGEKITEQLIPKAAKLMELKRMTCISVINYETDIYSKHLRS